jgi:hypothetical protein
LSPAGMSCVRTEDKDVFVAEDEHCQKLKVPFQIDRQNFECPPKI